MYVQHRNKMKFGDVIAFSGNGLVSSGIKITTGSNISHVGMVYDVMGRFGDRRIMMMESTTLNDAPDAIHGGFIKGVQVHFLGQILKRYDGEVFWCQLNQDISEDNQKSMETWLSKKHAEKTPYDNCQVMGAGLDIFDAVGIGNNCPDFSKLFCSEMIAKAYKTGGLWDGNPSEVTPADIMEWDILESPIRIDK